QRRRKQRSQPVQPDRGLHRERRTKANHFGKLLGRSHLLFRRHHLVDDRLLQAFLGGQTAIAKREIGGRSARQRAVHLVRRAQAANIGVLVADPGTIRHYPQLALQDDVQSHAYGEAVDGGDERLFQVHVLRLPASAPVGQRIIRVLVWRT